VNRSAIEFNQPAMGLLEDEKNARSDFGRPSGNSRHYGQGVTGKGSGLVLTHPLVPPSIAGCPIRFESSSQAPAPCDGARQRAVGDRAFHMLWLDGVY